MAETGLHSTAWRDPAARTRDSYPEGPMMGCTRWALLSGILGLFLSAGVAAVADPPQAGRRYLRFRAGDTTAYGILEGDRVRELEGDLFDTFTKTDRTHTLKEVTLLTPTRPTQVLALAGN